MVNENIVDSSLLRQEKRNDREGVSGSMAKKAISKIPGIGGPAADVEKTLRELKQGNITNAAVNAAVGGVKVAANLAVPGAGIAVGKGIDVAEKGLDFVGVEKGTALVAVLFFLFFICLIILGGGYAYMNKWSVLKDVFWAKVSGG